MQKISFFNLLCDKVDMASNLLCSKFYDGENRYVRFLDARGMYAFELNSA
jgi:hypothetical protein